jgi:BirA family biotin operon repressor/biotin-[acetyl-CoA-carboxylase] ligase
MIEIPGRRIDWFAELDSTMIEAKRDPEPGRIVIADRQTAGMGRHGKAWLSPSGEGLYVSYVLKLPIAPVISLAVGLAAREAIGDAADLRWPNDVLLGGCKCAGVLVQSDAEVVIAGIGINVSQRWFPQDLDTPATSLGLEGIQITREELLVKLTPALDRSMALSHDEVLRRFAEHSSFVSGKRVRAGEVEGVTCGLDDSGFLRVREDSGTITTILNGGVRPIGDATGA